MAQRDPQGAYNRLMQTNPAFAKFVHECDGKSPEQIAQERGIPYELVMRMMGQGGTWPMYK